MTALAGVWNLDGRPDAGGRCGKALSAQKIYGPHDTAQWDGGAISLGRNLFSILPEDDHDRQPLIGGNGRFVLVADVRLDNRDELARTLAVPDHHALADSSLLLAAWERWQESCLEHLFGDYAFAVWDKSKSALLLARDPMGGRPLHYHRAQSFLAFASMPKGLHALEEIPRQPDEETIAEHMAWLPEYGDRSFFKDVRRVEAGTFIVFTKDGARAQKHWDPKPHLVRLPRPDDYAEALLERLDGAVKARLRSAEAAIATQLSAGLDSSAVTTSAALSMGDVNRKVVAFTSVPRTGYAGPAPAGSFGDEGPLAAATAARYSNVEHVLVRAMDRSPFAALDRSFFLFDRPALNLCSNVWQSAIYDMAKARRLGVMLTGAGGNMTVSYDGLMWLPDLVAEGRLLRWMQESTALARRKTLPWKTILHLTIGPHLPAPVWRHLRRWSTGRSSDRELYSAMRPDYAGEHDMERRARAFGGDIEFQPRRDAFHSRLWALRRVDFGNLNKGTLGGWGIDVRDPTTDRRLVEFCLSLPPEQHLAGGQTKALLRRALAARVPGEVLATRQRGYQGIDWHEGLTGDRAYLAGELDRLENVEPAARAINIERLRDMIRAWPSQNWNTDQNLQSTYRLALLRAISSGHFLRRASGSNS